MRKNGEAKLQRNLDNEVWKQCKALIKSGSGEVVMHTKTTRNKEDGRTSNVRIKRSGEEKGWGHAQDSPMRGRGTCAASRVGVGVGASKGNKKKAGKGEQAMHASSGVGKRRGGGMHKTHQ